MTIVLDRCGTVGASGYMRHRRAGEPVCEDCRSAYRAYQLSYQQAWRAGRRWHRPSGRYLRRSSLTVGEQIVDVVETFAPVSLDELPALLPDVAELTLRRVVYQLMARGDITRNPVTLCYSVGSEEG